MPKVADQARPEFKKHNDSTKLKFYIRQECCRAILRVLESAAVGGVICRLKNRNDVEVGRTLFPRLTSMNFDQPEANLFFGLKNKSSCSKCKWRKGYSAFRKSTVQSGSAVRRLYKFANDTSSPFKKLATEKLQRWGFNPRRECCLHSSIDVNKLLVRIPGKDEVFPCLDFRDRMHGLFIFLHRIIVEALNVLELSNAQRRILDQRLHYVCDQRCFRDRTENAYRKQKTIFDSVGMTAADKVCLLFLLPHVLGPTADMIPEPLRYPVLTMVANAQLMIIAVSGHRSYTVPELEAIFDQGYILIFGALESIRQMLYEEKMRRHQMDPDDCPPPKKFKRQTRFDKIYIDLTVNMVLTLS